MHPADGIEGLLADEFTPHLERAKAQGRRLLDLTESDPGRCGLGIDTAELDAILARPRAASREEVLDPRPGARDAVASYLASRGVAIASDRIRFAASRGLARRLALQMVCDPGDEVLVASPSRLSIEGVAAGGSVRTGTYRLRFDGEWRLQRRDLEKAVTDRTRAILVESPSEPTGAIVGRDDLVFLQQLCGSRRIALVGDETFADTVTIPSASVAEVTQCLAVHISGLSGICGLSRLGAEWCAVAGPEELVGPALSRVDRRQDPDLSATSSALIAIPPVLARRAAFLSSLRQRLAANCAALAAGAVAECPWSLLWGRGGCWAVLEIGTAEREEVVCQALLEENVAVQPGSRFGLPDRGYLVLSLLPPPAIFHEATRRLDHRLRAPFVT